MHHRATTTTVYDAMLMDAGMRGGGGNGRLTRTVQNCTLYSSFSVAVFVSRPTAHSSCKVLQVAFVQLAAFWLLLDDDVRYAVTYLVC